MESNLEVYADQFTPWKPNKMVDEGDSSFDADFLYGASYTQFRQGDASGGTLTYLLLTSALITNFYLEILQAQSSNDQ